MFESIATFIKQFGHFSPDHLSFILHRLHVVNVEKGHFLIEKNQICQSFYFINKGALRHYHIEETGEETTLNLFIKNEWLFEYESFITQQPSKNIIQAVSFSELYGLTIQDFHELLKLSDKFFWPGYVFEQVEQNRKCQYLRLPLEERYQQLLAAKPELLTYFRLKYIASYLGMAQETLSRVRKKVKPPSNII